MIYLYHSMQFISKESIRGTSSLSLSEWINMRNILGNYITSINHIKDGVLSPQNKVVDGRMETKNIDKIALKLSWQ